MQCRIPVEIDGRPQPISHLRKPSKGAERTSRPLQHPPPMIHTPGCHRGPEQRFLQGRGHHAGASQIRATVAEVYEGTHSVHRSCGDQGLPPCFQAKAMALRAPRSPGREEANSFPIHWVGLTFHAARYQGETPSTGSAVQRSGASQMLKRQPSGEMAVPPLVPLLALTPPWSQP